MSEGRVFIIPGRVVEMLQKEEGRRVGRERKRAGSRAQCTKSARSLVPLPKSRQLVQYPSSIPAHFVKVILMRL